MDENGTHEPEIMSERALITRESGEVALAGYVTRVGLRSLPEDLQQDEWVALLESAKTFADAAYWVAGDLGKEGEARYGEAYAQFVDQLGYEPSTLQAAIYVAKTIPFDDRRPDLSWSCHQVVAGLKDPEQRKAWLQSAAENKWTREQLRAALREVQGRDKVKGRPASAESKKKKALAKKGPSITEKDFNRLVDKDLEPALKTGIGHCKDFIKNAEKLMADLDKGKTDQDRFEAFAKDIHAFGLDLPGLGNALVKARDIVQAIADYEPEPEPEKQAAPKKKKADAPKKPKAAGKAKAKKEKAAAPETGDADEPAAGA